MACRENRRVRGTSRTGITRIPSYDCPTTDIGGTLPVFDDHKDPFDRLLVAQSLTEPLVFLTVDSTLARYGSTVRVL